MNVSGMLHGAGLLKIVDFPASEVLGPEASEHDIHNLIEKCGSVFVKPIFRGGIGKKGKSGLIGRATDLKSALAEKERLYFAEYKVGNVVYKSRGVTFEGAVPAQHEIYFSITDSTRYRAPVMTLTHHGGMDIEELDKTQIIEVPFDPLTGLKSFIVSNALTDLGAPKEIISPLVQHLPKLWDLYHHYGMSTLELNPIRMMPSKSGSLIPVACDFKCGFDRDDPRVNRLTLPDDLFVTEANDFEQEINELRTYQGQSDVYVDFGGKPPYEKMYDVMRISLKYYLKQTNVLFIIGGKANNTDIFVTFRAMADALRDYFSERGATPLYVVIGRGGPQVIRGMGAFKDVLDSLRIPYKIFGFDSAMTDVVNYAQEADRWMKSGGRAEVAKLLGLPADA
ncbi:MAG: carboxylate--amine ligase [Nitrosomonadales bacterium]|nr:carboxylate--amine ligase [Nitrosomonadales bacterium]